MGFEDIYIRALAVDYVNVTSNGTNGTIITQLCFSKSSLSLDAIHLFEFYLHVFIMSIVIAFGIFGNVVIIWIATRRLNFTSNYFLMIIALADFFVLVTYGMYFTMPTVYEYLGFATEYFKFFSLTQEYIWFCFVTAKAVSTYGVVMMLMDRYAWLVTQKRKHGNMSNLTNARLATSLIFALAIMFAFPKMLLFETSLAHDPCRDVYALNIATRGLIDNRLFLIAYEASTEFSVTYVLPLLLMLPLLRGIHRRKVMLVRRDSNASSAANRAHNMCMHCVRP